MLLDSRESCFLTLLFSMHSFKNSVEPSVISIISHIGFLDIHQFYLHCFKKERYWKPFAIWVLEMLSVYIIYALYRIFLECSQVVPWFHHMESRTFEYFGCFFLQSIIFLIGCLLIQLTVKIFIEIFIEIYAISSRYKRIIEWPTYNHCKTPGNINLCSFLFSLYS